MWLIGVMSTAVVVAFTAGGLVTTFNREQTDIQQTLSGVATTLDTLSKKVIHIEAQLSQINSGQEALKSSFIGLGGSLKSTQNAFLQYVSRDNTLTKQEFLNYMEGFQFEIDLRQTPSVPNLSIGVRKKDDTN